MNDSEKSKIIIDSDWKEQVAAEKASQLNRASAVAPDGTEATSPPSADPNEVPEASLLMLIVSFATQAMVGLGQVPNPADGSVSVDLAMAKVHIDLLNVLREKTQGNLDEEETRYLEASLSQLRMAYVQVNNAL